ncbi:DgyrCDS7189 [Dimorphilus gyrociliatus]|uniref:Conserved oligomeric Golgi complex subunit 1 n=1 Tax=Dimorphilus gyrociliatus TaxID=2664684 RepID=A0A7I8VS29_9ANNE|nr:DgyrCDS7189 [Dimorphilus gyrociliatus]
MPQSEDVTTLFEGKPIQDIIAIEQSTRAEIEKKKENLRQMVGERYRDIIDAADTIRDMKSNAEKMELQISKVDSGSAPFLDSIMACSSIENDFEMCKQVKMYMSMSEHIWEALSAKKFLLATQLYLITKNIQSNIQRKFPHILQNAPVIHLQWVSLIHFKTTILNMCRNVLQMIDVDDDIVAESLSAILFLENFTCRQVLRDFLVGRTNALQKACRTETQSVTIKSKICKLVTLMFNSLYQIYVIFAKENYESFILHKLRNNTQKEYVERLLDQFSCKEYTYLVINDTSSKVDDLCVVSENDLRSLCEEWFIASSKLIKENVSDFLMYLDSIKSMSNILESIWELLKEDSRFSLWHTICRSILGYEMCVWKDILSPMFQKRIEQLVTKSFDEMLEKNNAFLDDMLRNVTDIQRDINIHSYVWQEQAEDLTSDCAWMSSSAKSLTSGGGLVMKTKGYSPSVQRFCKYVNASIKSLLEDMEYFLKRTYNGYSVELEDEEKLVFDKYSLNEKLTNSLLDLTESYLKKLIEELRTRIKREDNNEILARVGVLLGRIADSLLKLCPSITQCILNSSYEESVKFLKNITKIKSEKNSKWFHCENLLSQFFEETLSLWTDYAIIDLVGKFEVHFSGISLSSFIYESTKWDEILIEEKEDDNDKAVSTQIRIPMTASWYVHDLLFNARLLLHTIGGHSIPRTIIQKFTSTLWRKVLENYQHYLTSSKSSERVNQSDGAIRQVIALQMLFDVQFLHSFLCADKILNEEYQSVLQDFEKRVDPFDFAVFSPPMSQHLQRQCQKNKLFFGIFTGKDSNPTDMRKTMSGNPDQHNLLAITSTTTRFSLFPVTSNRSVSERLEKSQTAPVQAQGESFLDNIPWFRNN